jgi:hypothetical protein
VFCTFASSFSFAVSFRSGLIVLRGGQGIFRRGQGILCGGQVSCRGSLRVLGAKKTSETQPCFGGRKMHI